MRLKHHFVVSLIISIVIFYYLQDFSSALLFFMLGFLIDFDHYIWYVVVKKGTKPSEVLDYFEEIRRKLLNKEKVEKLYLPLHSLDFLIISTGISFIIGNFFLLFGLIVHYLMDAFYGYYKFGLWISPRKISVLSK